MIKGSIIIKTMAVLITLICGNTFGQDLKDHQWKNRILIVKTTNPESEIYYEQLQEFKISEEDFKERKLVIYSISKSEYYCIDFTDRSLDHSGKTSKQLSQNIFEETEDFEIILIGLDGQIKLRQNLVLSKDVLFSIIDAMPMQQNEIRD